jgi:hypothetical protein
MADGMTPSRRRLVGWMLTVVVGVSFAHAVAGQEHWPFCAYKMFAGVRTDRDVATQRLFGVVEGDGREVPLLDNRWIAPFDQSRLERGIWRVGQKESPERTRGALANVLARYEARRAAGLHDGPPLTGIRLYKLRWPLDPEARNVDAPATRELLAEVGATQEAQTGEDE